jgi:hypothetical protein
MYVSFKWKSLLISEIYFTFPHTKLRKVIICTSRFSYRVVLLMYVKEIISLSSTICEISSLFHRYDALMLLDAVQFPCLSFVGNGEVCKALEGVKGHSGRGDGKMNCQLFTLPCLFPSPSIYSYFHPLSCLSF